MAHDAVADKYQLIGGYFSPVSDAYGKSGLTGACHRVQMCNLALNNSDWLMVDPWESRQRSFQRTAVVLDHFKAMLNAPTTQNSLLRSLVASHHTPPSRRQSAAGD